MLICLQSFAASESAGLSLRSPDCESGLPKIILTPHLVGPSWENWKKAFRDSFDNIERIARGEKPLWVIPELRD